MTTYTDEVNIYNPDAIGDAIDDAGNAYKTYITEVSNDGIWVHPNGAGPSSGTPVSTTTGWHISDVLEYWKEGASWFKLWLNTTLNKMQMRLGLESSGHVVLDDGGMDVLTDSITSVAKFGNSGARIGKEDNSHISLTADEMSISNVDGVAWFDVDMDAGATPGRYVFTAASATDYHDYDSNTFSGNASNYLLSSNSHVLSGVSSGVTVSIDSEFGMESLYRPSMYAEYQTLFDADDAVTSSSDISVMAAPGGSGMLYIDVDSAISITTGQSGTWAYTVSNVRMVADGTDVASGVEDGDVLGILSFTMTVAYNGGTNEITCSGTVTVTDFVAAFRIESFTAFRGSYQITTTGAALTFGERISGSGIGILSSALGNNLTASGKYAFAEGDGATASGQASHAGGTGTKATRNSQTAIGKYNKNDTGNTYAVIVGNGTSDSARSNALAVDWDGGVDQWNPHIDMTTAPSNAVYDRMVEVFDKNGDPIGWLQVSQDTSGLHSVCIGASNSDDSAQNQLQLGYDASDNPTAWASQPTVLRKALGALAVGDFVVEEVSTHSSVSIGAGSNSYKNGTKSKSGYYPLGIVGTYTSDFRCPIAYANLTSQASGSAGWAVNIGNWSSSSRTVNANIKILWVKE